MVVEGPQFKVGGVDVTGNAVLPVEEIKRRIKLKPGDVFSRTKLRDSTKAITDLYSAIGRASADVSPKIVQDTPNRMVNITFEITEGPEVFVERINITGNTRSQEKILRREIPMAEGDLFTSQKLARAKQRLMNLNYFDKVEAKTAPGPDQGQDHRQHRRRPRSPPASSPIGGGYSSQDGVLGTLDLSQRNFLGRGWEVFLRLRGGAQTQQGHHRLHGALALRPAPRPPASTSSTTGGSSPDYTVNSLGRRHPLRPPHRGILARERCCTGRARTTSATSTPTPARSSCSTGGHSPTRPSSASR